jgi:FkbM family methyltransferase
MLIPFDHLNKRYQLKITGFIQAGAHHGEELEEFRNCLMSRDNGPLIFDNIHMFEPLPRAFDVLNRKVISEKVYNVALGEKDDVAILHVDKENQGQSSSILVPELHKTQYPDITFPEEILVEVKTLDSYQIKTCNALWMDVQGYELNVLKGAIKTLEFIDYIYTEVNVDEVYKDCARLYQMDEFLKTFGFERVELDLFGKTWGDAFYIKKKLIPERKYSDVPVEFQQKNHIKYPPDNDQEFEEWFASELLDTVLTTGYNGEYLPVLWTGFYVNNDFGKDQRAIQRLQGYLDSLSNKGKYFTIVQYDDGILNDFMDKDITVFSMGGGAAKGRNVKIIPIPLIGQTHRFNFDGVKKDVMCNFIGRIETHPIRKKMQDFLNRKLDFYFHFNKPLDQYCHTLARSYFTLAPRGYGKTSFRIWEALQYQSVPIYVTEDEPFLPEFYDHERKPCMLICTPAEIESSMYKLFSNKELYNQYVENGKFYYSRYYNYEGLANYIIDFLNQKK